MNLRSVKRAAAAAALSSFFALAVVPGVSHSADALRPEVAKPLNDAQTCTGPTTIAARARISRGHLSADFMTWQDLTASGEKGGFKGGAQHRA